MFAIFLESQYNKIRETYEKVICGTSDDKI